MVPVGYAIEGRLADHYAEIFAKALESYGVGLLEIDGIVLLRLWDRIADPTGYVFNADQRTIRYLADPEKGHPIWEDMPYDARDRLMQLKRSEIDLPHCEFWRMIVLRNWGRD